jgi:hypothetical protein
MCLAWAAREGLGAEPAAVPPALQTASGQARATDGPDEGRPHWAFVKLVRPPVPRVLHADRVRTPVDAFVLARLEAKGLTFSAEADRVTLLRRASLDLLGLPPSLPEIDAFLADDRPDAYERLIDRLLASPHYGERWGRHWLDAAGYADTGGPDNDAEIITPREGLWKYRDYVVASLNADKPYDQFVREQLAGDEMDDWRAAAVLTPTMREHLTATGFLRTAVDNTDAYELNQPPERYDVLHRTLETLTAGLLGLTVACARCHDHKFDPISQEEYYRLMACLTPAYNQAAWVQPKDRYVADATAREKEEIARHNAALDRRAVDLNRALDALRRPAEERLSAAKLAAVPEVLREDVRAALATEAGKRTPVQQYLAGKLGPLLQVTPEEVNGALAPADGAKLESLRNQVAALNGQRRTPGKIQALFDVGPAPATHVLKRGNPYAPGREVRPGFLSALTPDTGRFPSPASAGTKTSGRRTALAAWLIGPDHPLTSRVQVNRVWQHYFGEGIVATPENFGVSGERPTHPELLDWLSTELVRGGWQLKRLHRLILTSTVYRQASALPEGPGGQKAAALDPEDRLLWRMRLRRVEAEVLRDAVLTVSGRLDCTLGGPPVPFDTRKDGLVVVATKGLPTPTSHCRRSLYLLARRNYQLSLLTDFDTPVMTSSCTRRTRSVVPQQALTLLNDALVLEQADAMAARVLRVAGDSPGSRVEVAFRLALARRPSAREATWGAELLTSQERRYHGQGLPTEPAKQKALGHLCHMLLCANEFLYIN